MRRLGMRRREMARRERAPRRVKTLGTHGRYVRNWPWATPVFGILLAGLATGLTYNLDGILRTDEPMAFAGVVGPGPDSSVRGAYVRAPEDGAVGHLLVRAEEARLLLQQDPTDPVEAPGPVGPQRGLSANRPTLRTNVTLELLDILSPPQIAVSAQGGPSRAIRMTAEGAHCRIGIPPDGGRAEFPDDANRTQGTDVTPFVAGPEQLVGDCRVDAFSAQNTTRIKIYGFRLRLISAEDEPTLVTTGTLREPDQMGLSERAVTRILLVDFNRGRIDFFSPPASEVRFYASQFTGVGQVGAGASQGQLAWGPELRKGSIDPFQATGEFRLSRAGEAEVALQGTTLDRAPWPQDSWVAIPSDPTTLVLGTVAVAGLAAVAGYAAFLLFSRLVPDRVLNNPRRAQILELVRSQPGIHTNAIARTVGLRWANTIHHIAVLSSAGHVSVRRVGGRTALFPAKSGYYGKETQIALLRRPTQRRIHELLTQEPGLDQETLATRLALDQSRISRALGSLGRVGLVRSEQDGRQLRYYTGEPP